MTGDGDRDAVALQLMALSRERALDHFIRSLPEDVRREVEETLQLKHELTFHLAHMLADDWKAATVHATWVSARCQEIAYRWAVLRSAVHKWSLRDVEPFEVRR